MLKRLIAATVIATTLVSTGALAETNQPHTNSTQSIQSLPQEISQKLKRQGFTDVRVVPSSFIVIAKDKDGDPVTMVIGPRSTTMFTLPSSDESSNISSGSSNSSSTTGTSSSSSE